MKGGRANPWTLESDRHAGFPSSGTWRQPFEPQFTHLSNGFLPLTRQMPSAIPAKDGLLEVDGFLLMPRGCPSRNIIRTQRNTWHLRHYKHPYTQAQAQATGEDHLIWDFLSALIDLCPCFPPARGRRFFEKCGLITLGGLDNNNSSPFRGTDVHAWDIGG